MEERNDGLSSVIMYYDSFIFAILYIYADETNIFFRYGVSAGITNFIPAVEWLPGDLFKIQKVLQNSDETFKFVKDIIAEHMDKKNDGTANDYITAYLQHLKGLDDSGQQTTFSRKFRTVRFFFLSHNTPCFQCNIASTNFLVSHTCEIRFHGVIGQNTVRMYSYAKILIHYTIHLYIYTWLINRAK